MLWKDQSKSRMLTWEMFPSDFIFALTEEQLDRRLHLPWNDLGPKLAAWKALGEPSPPSASHEALG